MSGKLYKPASTSRENSVLTHNIYNCYGHEKPGMQPNGKGLFVISPQIYKTSSHHVTLNKIHNVITARRESTMIGFVDW